MIHCVSKNKHFFSLSDTPFWQNNYLQWKGKDIVFFFEMANLEFERQMISEMKDALRDMTSRKSSSGIR